MEGFEETIQLKAYDKPEPKPLLYVQMLSDDCANRFIVRILGSDGNIAVSDSNIGTLQEVVAIVAAEAAIQTVKSIEKFDINIDDANEILRYHRDGKGDMALLVGLKVTEKKQIIKEILDNTRERKERESIKVEEVV